MAAPRGIDTADLDNRFNFHPATPTTGQLHDMVRLRCLELAAFINTAVPDGREKSLAITKLEEVMMWCNAAVARHG